MNRILRYLNYVRLALFPISYGLLGALVSGTLNRVLIADLGYSAALVGVLLAVPLFVSPSRLWLGYRSDGYPILGRRREPYIIAGALLAGLGVLLAVLLALNPDRTSALIVGGLLLTFALYGVGRNLAHNTFEALLTDTFSGDARRRAATLYEVATLLGLVMGAGALGKALEEFDPARLVSVTAGAALAALTLALFAALGQEPRTEITRQATARARQMPFGQALREVVMADPQVRLFFVLVLFTFVGTLAQDVLLEPYGALVLNMPVGETTRLTMYWGLGVMASMLISAAFLLKWLGYLTVLRAGLIASMAVFVGIIAAGLMGNAGLFKSLVVVMGLGTGLAGAGMLSGVISFTTSIRAGLLMGVWGMANLLGKAFGSVMGGSVVDVMQAVTGGNAPLAYATVFTLEVVMLAIALALSLRFNLASSRAQQEERQTLASAASAD